MKASYILILFCVVFMSGALHAQTTLGVDWTRARIMHGWVGTGGPVSVELTINNDNADTVFYETISTNTSSKWFYIKSSASHTVASTAGFELNFDQTAARVATYVLYGPADSDPIMGVWTDSTDRPPRGQARIRFSSTINEDLAVKIGLATEQLAASTDIKSYVEFDVEPGSIQITTEDSKFTSTHTVLPDVTYRAIHVKQGITDIVLLDITCDYSVTGRWNTVNLVDSDATFVRGGVGGTTQTLVMANSATQYDEYLPGDGQVQISFLSPAINYNYQVNVFMAGFEEITMVIGTGISMNVDYIPQTSASKAKVVFKNDWSTTTIAVEGQQTALFADQRVGWSQYAELPAGSTTFTFTGLAFPVTMTLEAHNVYLVAFNDNGAVTMVQAESGAPFNVRYIHAMTTCSDPTSVFFSNNKTSPLVSSVAYGTDSGYVATGVWAGYYKYMVQTEDGTIIAAAAFRSQPNFSYSLIAIGKCDIESEPFVKVFYWQDDNTLAAAGKARVKALHGAYDTSPANPILQLDGFISLEQMTFGYYSELYKEITGGVQHVLNVAFDSSRTFNKTVFFVDRSVSTVVTAGSWSDDSFNIFVFTDAAPDSAPSSNTPQNAPSAAPARTNSPQGSTSVASTNSVATAVLVVVSLALVY